MKVKGKEKYNEEITTLFDENGKIVTDPKKASMGTIARFKNGELVEEIHGDVKIE